MFRKLLLSAAVVVGTGLAMAPDDADARWRRGFYRAAPRPYVTYRPNYYRGYYAPRRSYYGRSYYGYGPRYYGRSYYAPRGGVGITFGRGGFFYGW